MTGEMKLDRMLVWVTSTSGVSDARCRLDGESTTCVKASGGLTIAKDDRGPLGQASQLPALEGCKRSDALQSPKCRDLEAASQQY